MGALLHMQDAGTSKDASSAFSTAGSPLQSEAGPTQQIAGPASTYAAPTQELSITGGGCQASHQDIGYSKSCYTQATKMCDTVLHQQMSLPHLACCNRIFFSSKILPRVRFSALDDSLQDWVYSCSALRASRSCGHLNAHPQHHRHLPQASALCPSLAHPL